MEGEKQTAIENHKLAEDLFDKAAVSSFQLVTNLNQLNALGDIKLKGDKWLHLVEAIENGKEALTAILEKLQKALEN